MPTTPPKGELRVLFVCTGNSARSQIAEALLNFKGKGRFHAESAGAQPAAQADAYAIDTLREHRIPWAGRQPRGLDGLERQPWDVVITVCDRAREACPVFPGQPVLAHWGMRDPAEVEGDDATKRRAFRDAFWLLARRIDLLLALPVERLAHFALQSRLRTIGTSHPDVAASVPYDQTGSGR
jgi:arsenate reductase (thioredoxin)